MRIRESLTAILSLMVACCAVAQGTFVYDQQSSADETPLPLGQGGRLPTSPGLGYGQSFTPSLSSIGFIRLLLDDADVANSGGATVLVNLRSDSTTGTIIGTSASVHMLNGFTGPATFLLPAPVSVVPGATYYLEAVQVSGTPWNAAIGQYSYPGGTAFVGGSAIGPQDYWFREGIIIPEPSSATFLLLGGAALVCLHRQARR